MAHSPGAPAVGGYAYSGSRSGGHARPRPDRLHRLLQRPPLRAQRQHRRHRVDRLCGRYLRTRPRWSNNTVYVSTVYSPGSYGFDARTGAQVFPSRTGSYTTAGGRQERAVSDGQVHAVQVACRRTRSCRSPRRSRPPAGSRPAPRQGATSTEAPDGNASEMTLNVRSFTQMPWLTRPIRLRPARAQESAGLRIAPTTSSRRSKPTDS